MAPEVIACDKSKQASYGVKVHILFSGPAPHDGPKNFAKIEFFFIFQCDIWALGITAIELAQLEPPLFDLHPMRALMLIPLNDPPTLSNPKKWQVQFSSFFFILLEWQIVLTFSLRSFRTRTFRDFIAAALVKDPALRPTTEQLLKHPFLHMSENLERKVRQTLLESVGRRIPRSFGPGPHGLPGQPMSPMGMPMMMPNPMGPAPVPMINTRPPIMPGGGFAAGNYNQQPYGNHPPVSHFGVQAMQPMTPDDDDEDDDEYLPLDALVSSQDLPPYSPANPRDQLRGGRRNAGAEIGDDVPINSPYRGRNDPSQPVPRRASGMDQGGDVDRYPFSHAAPLQPTFSAPAGYANGGGQQPRGNVARGNVVRSSSGEISVARNNGNARREGSSRPAGADRPSRRGDVRGRRDQDDYETNQDANDDDAPLDGNVNSDDEVPLNKIAASVSTRGPSGQNRPPKPRSGTVGSDFALNQQDAGALKRRTDEDGNNANEDDNAPVEGNGESGDGLQRSSSGAM
jgi:hypothetical protein